VAGQGAAGTDGGPTDAPTLVGGPGGAGLASSITGSPDFLTQVAAEAVVIKIVMGGYLGVMAVAVMVEVMLAVHLHSSCTRWYSQYWRRCWGWWFSNSFSSGTQAGGAGGSGVVIIKEAAGLFRFRNMGYEFSIRFCKSRNLE
jgi:hypothetical protein